MTRKMDVIQQFPYFKKYYINGHGLLIDFSYLQFPDNQIDQVKEIIKSIGWNIDIMSVRFEYNNILTISIDTNEILPEIIGYRYEEPKIEYGFLHKIDNVWNLFFSSSRVITPFSSENFIKLIEHLKENNISYTLPTYEDC